MSSKFDEESLIWKAFPWSAQEMTFSKSLLEASFNIISKRHGKERSGAIFCGKTKPWLSFEFVSSVDGEDKEDREEEDVEDECDCDCLECVVLFLVSTSSVQEDGDGVLHEFMLLWPWSCMLLVCIRSPEKPRYRLCRNWIIVRSTTEIMMIDDDVVVMDGRHSPPYSALSIEYCTSARMHIELIIFLKFTSYQMTSFFCWYYSMCCTVVLRSSYDDTVVDDGCDFEVPHSLSLSLPSINNHHHHSYVIFDDVEARSSL